MGNINSKHIWEGWTVQDFIDDLSLDIEMIMNGRSHQKPFNSKEELSEWCKDHQPYYKKKIAGVNNYFAKKYNLN